MPSAAPQTSPLLADTAAGITVPQVYDDIGSGGWSYGGAYGSGGGRTQNQRNSTQDEEKKPRQQEPAFWMYEA
jgi:hypothetical protein